MLTKRALFVTAVGVSTIAAVVAWHWRKPEAPTAVNAREEGGDEVGLLRSRIAQLESASIFRAAAASQPGKTQPVPAEQPLPATAEAAAPALKQHMPDELEYSAQLEDKFRSQASDPSWSQKATGEVTRALAGDLTQGSRLGTVECRTDLCRVETSHDSLKAYQAFLQSALLSREKKLWNAGLSTQVLSQSQAGLAAVTFIAKEGQAVPLAEPLAD